MAKKHHKAEGGTASDDPPRGTKLYEADVKSKTPMRNIAPNIKAEAEEKKHGGRAKRHKRRRGGHVHHEKSGEMAHAHHVGKVKGSYSSGHKGKASRGGKSGSNFNPLSSAHAGTSASGHKAGPID